MINRERKKRVAFLYRQLLKELKEISNKIGVCEEAGDSLRYFIDNKGWLYSAEDYFKSDEFKKKFDSFRGSVLDVEMTFENIKKIEQELRDIGELRND